jgi:oxamate amidohydrolase
MSGAVTTPHPLATAAGQAVLDKGGTAVEALIAAGAVLSVVMPHFCGLGGDAVWLVQDRTGAARCFLAIGQGIDRPAPDGPIPTRGAQSILTTAAVVDGWDHALRDARATMGAQGHWADLLQPAITLAEEGIAVSASQAFWGRFRDAESTAWPGFAAVFRANGQPLAQGHPMRQPALAASLRAIAQDGAQAFYHGPLSRRIVDGLRAAGAMIGPQDLAATQTRAARPLSLPYRGLTLLAPPPPTQGITTLQIMGILSRFDLRAAGAGSADHLHLVVEAVKQAFLARGGIADPAVTRQDTDATLAPAQLDRMAAAIRPDRALDWPHRWQHGDTVFLGAMDAAGNAASVLQSTYFDWGSGVVAGDTGILWQNRGAAFSHDPAHPNAFAPGKLPFYTLNPGMALRNGQPALVYGTQGADGQPQTLAMLLTRLIDFDQPPPVALAAPRFLLGRTFSDSRDSLKLEADVPAATQAALRARGHEISPIAAQSPLAGQAGILRRDPGGSCAAWHDPRG